MITREIQQRSSGVQSAGRDLTVIVLSNSSNSGPSSHDIAKSLLAAACGTGAGN